MRRVLALAVVFLIPVGYAWAVCTTDCVYHDLCVEIDEYGQWKKFTSDVALEVQTWAAGNEDTNGVEVEKKWKDATPVGPLGCPFSISVWGLHNSCDVDGVAQDQDAYEACVNPI